MNDAITTIIGGQPATASTKEIADAFDKARALIDELGEDHPKALLAIIRAVGLANPDFMDKALKESGLTLPAPTHVDGDGNRLYSSESIAESFGVPHEQVVQDINKLAAEGDITAPAVVHPIH